MHYHSPGPVGGVENGGRRCSGASIGFVHCDQLAGEEGARYFVFCWFLTLRCQISDDICRLLFFFNKLSLEKKFIRKVERLNVKQRRSR